MKTIDFKKQPTVKGGVIFLMSLAWGGLLSILIVAIIGARTPQAANRAEVNQVQGILIFTDSHPLQNYIVLGTVKTGVFLGSVQYRPLRDHLLKKLRKDFPAANGAILNFTSSGDYAQAIKLQE